MRKKLALYNPYLDVMGGGEKHILSILKVLEEEYEINIFWDKNLSKQIEDKFALKFKNNIKFIPNVFKKRLSFLISLSTLKDFDLFFYVTDGSYFFSTAKNNFIFSMYPQKSLYQMNIINRLKTLNYKFICNSKFTSQWLLSWGIKNNILYPYIDDVFFMNNNRNKEKIILSVGRFYEHLHAKQHKTTINFFQKVKQKIKELKDFKLIIVGSLKSEDKPYFEYLNKLVKDDKSIELKENISFDDLVTYYKKSKFYLHMAGFGIDENKNPERVEHLGITPLEAMASGCLTFCCNVGGPKEIINNEKNGILFDNLEDLTIKFKSIINKQELIEKITSYAGKFVKENFSYDIFKKKVKKIID